MKKAGILLLLLLVAPWAISRQELPFCEELPGMQRKSSTVQEKMAQGIAAFDQGEYSRAANAFKQALHLNPSPADAGVAYKYLAFYYCINGAALQCETEFLRALQADPEFALEPAEQNHQAWSGAYVRALTKHQGQCVPKPAVQVAAATQTPSQSEEQGAIQTPSQPEKKSAAQPKQKSAVKTKPSTLSTAEQNDTPSMKLDKSEKADERVKHLTNQEAAGKGVAILRLNVFPWGTVYVDGKEVALTPPQKEVEVTAGMRQVEVRSNNSASTFSQTYTLAPGEEVVLSYRF